MPLLKCLPHDGLNRRFPQHKITGKDKQFAREYRNLIALDGRIGLIEGASRLNSNTITGDVKWAKRLYLNIGDDELKNQFCIIGGSMYRLREDLGTLDRVPIDNAFNAVINQDFFPSDAQFEVSEQLTTILVDGENFFKYNGNLAGNWEKLPEKNDIDGNRIYPEFIAQYLDRAFVLDRHRNVILVSENLNPEVFDNSTDCMIISVPPGDGGYPKGLIFHRGILFVVHEDYFAPISGNSIATFGIRPGEVVYGYGTRAPRSILKLNTQFGFLNSTDNEYYITGGTIDSTEKTPLSYPIKLSELINPVKAELTTAHLDTRRNLIRIAYYPSGGSAMGDEEIYSIDEKKWCGQSRERYVSCYSQWNKKGDDGRLVTGRSDTGVLMWNNAGSRNYDSAAIHYKLVTASYVSGDDNENLQFERFFIDAKALGSFSIPFAYYLDARITTSGINYVNMQGEIINLGLIEIADQDVFMNPILPLIDYSKGRMIFFQIEETELNRVFEMYGIYAEYTSAGTKQNKMTGT